MATQEIIAAETDTNKFGVKVYELKGIQVIAPDNGTSVSLDTLQELSANLREYNGKVVLPFIPLTPESYLTLKTQDEALNAQLTKAAYTRGVLNSAKESYEKGQSLFESMGLKDKPLNYKSKKSKSGWTTEIDDLGKLLTESIDSKVETIDGYVKGLVDLHLKRPDIAEARVLVNAILTIAKMNSQPNNTVTFLDTEVRQVFGGVDVYGVPELVICEEVANLRQEISGDVRQDHLVQAVILEKTLAISRRVKTSRKDFICAFLPYDPCSPEILKVVKENPEDFPHLKRFIPSEVDSQPAEPEAPSQKGNGKSGWRGLLGK